MDKKQYAGAAGFAVVVAVVVAFFTLMILDGSEQKEEIRSGANEFLTAEGIDAQSLQCSFSRCDGIADGEAFTLLVQEDEDGEYQYGLAPYKAPK